MPISCNKIIKEIGIKIPTKVGFLNPHKKTSEKLADVTRWFHWLWLFLVVFGLPVTFFYEKLTYFYLVITTTTIVSVLLWLGGCPLTILENSLRKQASSEYTPSKNFNERYSKNIFKNSSALNVSIVLVVTTLSMAGLIYKHTNL